MSDVGMITGATFALASSVVLLLFVSFGGRRGRLHARLQGLATKNAPPALNPIRRVALDALPRVGRALMPTAQEERTKLQARLLHAGYYGRQALAIFFGVKLMLMVGPALVGLLLGIAGA